MTVVPRGSGTSRGGAGGWQVSLGALIMLVLAAGLAAGVLRSVRGVWGGRYFPIGAGPAAPPFAGIRSATIDRTVGFALEIAAVCLTVMLARGLIGLYAAFKLPGGQARRGRAWCIAWRMGAIFFLIWFLSEESRLLRIDLADEIRRSQQIPIWNNSYHASLALFPVCGLLAILGISLGMGAGFLLPSFSNGRRRPYWLFVFLAAVIGILLVGSPSLSLISYLISVALEAVSNAMHHRLIHGPGLWTRLIHAGIEASIAGTMCVALALAVGRDFERLRRGETWTTSRAGRAIRLVLLAAAAGGGLALINVAIPRIHPWLLEGYSAVIGPLQVGMIAGGFGLLAAGLAARAVAGPPPGPTPVWVTRLSAGLRLGFLALIVLYALNCCPDEGTIDPSLPPFVSFFFAFWQGIVDGFWNHLPDGLAMPLNHIFTGEAFPWTLTGLVIVGFLLELAIRRAAEFHAPLDRLAESPGRVGLFLWLVVGLTVVCLSALPILIVAGQVVMHLRLHGAEILRGGWAN